jgi:uncharacterized protein YcbK (DUF882 family)
MLLAILPLHVIVLAGSLPAPPVEVTLFDANHKETHVVEIGRDGSIDADTRKELRYAFRCRRSGKEKEPAPGLLAMIAAVQEHWPDKDVEYISAYRGWKGEGPKSPHRAGRAMDFRVPGVSLIELRNWLWTHFDGDGVGIGWYPTENFVHMDTRPLPDVSWTFMNGSNHYHPSWAERLREHHELDHRSKTKA